MRNKYPTKVREAMEKEKLGEKTKVVGQEQADKYKKSNVETKFNESIW